VLQLKNTTPFAAVLSLFPDPEGIDTLYVVVKATFELASPCKLTAQQVPVRLADEFLGEPGRSSVAQPGDVHLAKPSTDVLVLGRAWAPKGQPVGQLDCSVRVGALEKHVRVFGERSWKSGFFSTSPSAPTPFVSMPLVWERAFGGALVLDEKGDKVLWEPRNPVGRGIAARQKKAEWRAVPVPNLEDPAQPLTRAGQRPTPACFAPLAPSWSPRKEFAGTYDEAWQKNRAPYLPKDFDPRFFQLAPAGLVASAPLVGGEPVELVNLSQAGPVRTSLPGGSPTVSVRIAGRVEAPPPRLELVLIEPDAHRFVLLWRSALRCDKQALRVEEVTIEPGTLVFQEGKA
jgi:hypothetical protein